MWITSSRRWRCRARTSRRELEKVRAAGRHAAGRVPGQSRLPAGAACRWRARFTPRSPPPPRLPNEPWLHESRSGTASARSSGASCCRRSSGCRWEFCAGRTAFSPGCRSHSSSSSATCRRRLSARSVWRFSGSMTGRRSRSSSSAPSSSRCWSSATPCARSIRRSSRRRRRSARAVGSSCGGSIIPASITDIYTDMRILLGWAWTYLIVAEVVGTMSRHHVLHQPAGALPELRQRLCRDRA